MESRVFGQRPQERRRWSRVKLALPVLVTKAAGGDSGVVSHHTVRSAELSTGGLYVTTGEEGVFVPGEIVTVSVGIPWESRRKFPFTRIAGSCRVIRVNDVSVPTGKELGAALAFCGGDQTLLGTALTPR